MWPRASALGCQDASTPFHPPPPPAGEGVSERGTIPQPTARAVGHILPPLPGLRFAQRNR
jgi:hypothetical protein